MLHNIHYVLNLKTGDDVQIVISWAILLLVVAWWLLRPVLTTWKGVAWLAGVLSVVMVCVQVCNFRWPLACLLNLVYQLKLRGSLFRDLISICIPLARSPFVSWFSQEVTEMRNKRSKGLSLSL